jgi:hypothetical protein
MIGFSVKAEVLLGSLKKEAGSFLTSLTMFIYSRSPCTMQIRILVSTYLWQKHRKLTPLLSSKHGYDAGWRNHGQVNWKSPIPHFNHGTVNPPPHIYIYIYTRWFKYDRDLCGLFTHKSVPVIFESPCILEMISCLLIIRLQTGTM